MEHLLHQNKQLDNPVMRKQTIDHFESDTDHSSASRNGNHNKQSSKNRNKNNILSEEGQGGVGGIDGRPGGTKHSQRNNM